MNTETKTLHDDYCFICERETDHVGEHDDVRGVDYFTETREVEGITVYVSRVYRPHN